MYHSQVCFALSTGQSMWPASDFGPSPVSMPMFSRLPTVPRSTPNSLATTECMSTNGVWRYPDMIFLLWV